jgi:tRNA (guanine37-N1)-methyltransferase
VEIPDVLVSGDHGRIARWRREQALLITGERRPDLLAAARAEMPEPRSPKRREGIDKAKRLE